MQPSKHIVMYALDNQLLVSHSEIYYVIITGNCWINIKITLFIVNFLHNISPSNVNIREREVTPLRVAQCTSSYNIFRVVPLWLCSESPFSNAKWVLIYNMYRSFPQNLTKRFICLMYFCKLSTNLVVFT